MTTEELIRLKKLMKEHDLKMAVAESLTCGNIQASIGSISGASDFFEGGVTAYSLKQKVSLLQVGKKHAKKVNCVSDRVARQMAKGVCKRFKVKVGLATTGYAQPPAKAEFPEPHAYFAIWRGKVVKKGLIRRAGLGRIQMQKLVTDTVLRELLGYLEAL